jgi:hypothetical protein
MTNIKSKEIKMANLKSSDKKWMAERKKAIRSLEAMERKTGADIFRSAVRKFLENTRQEDRLARQIEEAETQLAVLRKKRLSGR